MKRIFIPVLLIFCVYLKKQYKYQNMGGQIPVYFNRISERFQGYRINLSRKNGKKTVESIYKPKRKC